MSYPFSDTTSPSPSPKSTPARLLQRAGIGAASAGSVWWLEPVLDALFDRIEALEALVKPPADTFNGG